jgi:drug/metabolite transporter (DMT)-like permease
VSSVSALATPVLGVISGIVVLHEPLTWHELAAGSFIIGAIALVHRREPEPAAAAEAAGS